MVDVSVIIVNFNTLELAKNAIASVIKFTEHITYEIILVDNNSNEFSIKELNKKYPKLKVIELDKNLGFGSANNIGVKQAKGRYLFLLNSDAYLIDNAILKFKPILENDATIATLGGNLITPNGAPNISYGNFLTVEKVLHDYGLFRIRRKGEKGFPPTSSVCDFLEIKEVDFITGAAIFIRKSYFQKIGGFNTKFFMYFEDMDLGYQFKKNGYKNLIVPSIKIVHIGGQSGLSIENFRSKILKHARYSKYIFLQNVTNKPVAFVLYKLGYFIKFYKKLKRKAKSIFLILNCVD